MTRTTTQRTLLSHYAASTAFRGISLSFFFFLVRIGNNANFCRREISFFAPVTPLISKRKRSKKCSRGEFESLPVSAYYIPDKRTRSWTRMKRYDYVQSLHGHVIISDLACGLVSLRKHSRPEKAFGPFGQSKSLLKTKSRCFKSRFLPVYADRDILNGPR